MGIHDRDYMRSKRPSYTGLPQTWTMRIIALVAVVFVLQLLMPPLTRWFWLSWPGFSGGKVWTILTAAFVHDSRGFGHVFYNVLGLYFFGRIAEESLGFRQFGRFVFGTAVLAHVPYLVQQAISGGGTPTLGASGIVLACLVLAAFRRPRATFLLFPLPIRIPLWVLASIYVLVDLSGVAGQVRGSGAGVNHLVHLSGAALGFVAHRMGGLPIPSLPGRRRRPPPDTKPAEKLRRHDDETRERVDRLLEKITKEGIGSLTDEEREFLNRASRHYSD